MQSWQIIGWQQLQVMVSYRSSTVQMSSDTNFFYRVTIRVPKLPDAGIASCEHLHHQEAIRACSCHTLDRRRCCTRLDKVDHARVIFR